MFTETVTYCADSVQVTLTTSPNGKRIIQVTGNGKLLQGVKAELKQFVERIGQKTVKFSIPGKH